MQIVIEIDDELYEEILSRKYSKTKLEKAVADGEPLPEGHGRLIDADIAITKAIGLMKYPANCKYMECVIAHLKLAPTIIEADKGAEE